jgi:hypothetical protein
MLELQEIGSLHADVKGQENTSLQVLPPDEGTQIVTFAIWHGYALNATLPSYILDAYQNWGEGYTAMFHGKPIAAAGVIFNGTGLASAWGMISDEAKTMPFMLHRTAKRLLETAIKTHHLRRIDFIADPYKPTAVHWAKRLGFTYECKMRAFYPDGHEALLFARITEGSR